MPITFDVKFGGETHKRIIAGIRDRVKLSRDYLLNTRHTAWAKAEDKNLAYLPERAVDATRRVDEREAGKPTYTTIEVPYSYAVLMAAHTYWTTVFMSRTPVFQFTGRHGESQQKVQAMEAYMDYQIQVGEQLVPYYIWLHDVGKYGVGILGNYWDEQTERVAEIIEVEETMLGGMFKTGRKKKKKIVRSIPGYQGNKNFNVRPFDFLPDPRVPLKRFQEGEFCGRYVEISWNVLWERETKGEYMNVDKIKHSGNSHAGGFADDASASSLEIPDASKMFSIGEGKDKKTGVVPAYEMVVKLIPEKWRLGRGKMPEAWVFTVTKDLTTVLGARPQGANHNKFPYAVIELEPEGYAVSTRGMHEILEPVNNTINWLVNSHFYNVRKTLNNQFLVDPSRLVLKDLLDPLPGGLIRMKPAAYGTDVRQYFHQVQTVDITRGHMNDTKQMLEVGSRVIGVNDQIMGMMSGTGRKTAAEVRTGTGFSINRLKTQSEFFSAMGWGPLSQMMVQNTQQYSNMDRALRVVGDLALEAPQFVNATPEEISGFYDYIPVDGTLPVDRFAQANLWRTLLTELRNYPEMAQQFDVGRIFQWVAQIAGLKNISQFKINIQQDGQLEESARKGDVVPINELRNLNEPGQVAGLGPTG